MSLRTEKIAPKPVAAIRPVSISVINTMLVRSANLSSMHMRLSASASSSFRPLSPHAFRCLAEASSSRSSSDAQESSSFRNNLRKGFAPLKKEKPIKSESTHHHWMGAWYICATRVRLR